GELHNQRLTAATSWLRCGFGLGLFLPYEPAEFTKELFHIVKKSLRLLLCKQWQRIALHCPGFAAVPGIWSLSIGMDAGYYDLLAVTEDFDAVLAFFNLGRSWVSRCSQPQFELLERDVGAK